MNIEIATKVTAELTAALATLIPQLSSSADPVTEDVLRRVLADPAITMFVARHENKIVGSLTLAAFTIPTGMRAWIEDVVVDESARGLGAGEALTLAALDVAKAKGATSVDLTSRPSREAANRLYLRMGFVARETNVYRFSLED
jgi:ribosomal protein S18 acetylase RimI-like enzyme